MSASGPCRYGMDVGGTRICPVPHQSPRPCLCFRKIVQNMSLWRCREGCNEENQHTHTAAFCFHDKNNAGRVCSPLGKSASIHCHSSTGEQRTHTSFRLGRSQELGVVETDTGDPGTSLPRT